MSGQSVTKGQAKRGGPAGRVKMLTQTEPEYQKTFNSTASAEDLYSLGGFTLYKTSLEDRQPGDYNILCSQQALLDVFAHLKEDTSREHGGLLLGYETGFGGDTIPTVVVLHAMRGNHTIGNSTSLTFNLDTWAEWDRQQEELRRLGIHLKRVGWYHSHPNIEIFLSRYDLDVCTTFDRLKGPVALVCDPIQDRGGFFVRGTEGYRTHSPQSFWTLSDKGSEESGVNWSNVTKVVALSASASSAASPSTEPDPAKPGAGEESFVQNIRRGSTSKLIRNLSWQLGAAALIAATVFLAFEVVSFRSELRQFRGEQTKSGQVPAPTVGNTAPGPAATVSPNATQPPAVVTPVPPPPDTASKSEGSHTTTPPGPNHNTNVKGPVQQAHKTATKTPPPADKKGQNTSKGSGTGTGAAASGQGSGTAGVKAGDSGSGGTASGAAAGGGNTGGGNASGGNTTGAASTGGATAAPATPKPDTQTTPPPSAAPVIEPVKP